MEAGTQLGEFTIVRPLASGGMGSVYLATGPTGERVAIKTVDSGSAAHLVSLRHEIRALLAMDHPSIVRIVGHGLYEAIPWFAMEFIEGFPMREHFTSSHKTKLLNEEIDTLIHAETLAALPQYEPPLEWNVTIVSPDEARVLLLQMAQVLRGLGHLHAAGLVHRDLKPENIVVRQRDQEPVIVDFGIATQSAGSARERLGRVANIAGTPAYMAPEQTLGQWSDARADLYSVGCMIYEILSGRPPFRADTFVQFAAAHVYAAVPPLPETVPIDLANLVYRLLAKAPEDRPGYGHDVAREIERILGVEPSDDTPPIYLYRPELVGREQAVEECERAVEALRSGEGGLTLITGPRGSGKTRFAIELSSRIDSMRDVECVLVAHNPNPEAAEGQNPFTSVLAEIADRCREQGPEFTRMAFEGRVAVLAKVHPPLLDLPGMQDVVLAPDLPAASEAMRRTQAFLELMQRVFLERPVALVLDEFDPRYLSYLRMIRSVHNTHPTQLWLFMTVSAEHGLILEKFARHQVVNLAPLDRETTGRFVRRALGLVAIPDAFVDLVYERSNGNPALAMELVRRTVDLGYLERNAHGQWLISAASDVRKLPRDTDAGRLMLNHVETFPVASQVLLQYLALAEHPLTMRVVEDLLGTKAALDRAIAPLLGCGAVEFRLDELRIIANQLQSAVRQKLRAETGRTLHSDLARALSAGPSLKYRVIAIHHQKAGEIEQARSAFLSAADAAQSRGDLDVRWENLRDYLETKAPVSDDLFDAYLDFLSISHRLTKTQDARGLAEEALGVAKSAGRPDVRARIMAIQATQLSSSDIDKALELMAQALDLVDKLDDDDVRSRVVAVYGALLLRIGRGADAEPFCSEARRLSQGLGDAYTATSAVLNHAVALLMLSRYSEAIRGLQEALTLSRVHNFEILEAYVLGNLSIIYSEHIEDLPEALRLVREALAMHRACLDLQGEAHASISEAKTLVLMHDFDDALQAAENALKLNIEAETDDYARLTARTVLGMALAGAGRIEEARTVFEEGRRKGGPAAQRLMHSIEAAAMERRLGDLDAAEAWLGWGSQNEAEWAIDDQNQLLAAQAHLAIARGNPLRWPPPNPMKRSRALLALERAIDSPENDRWFGESTVDAWKAMPCVRLSRSSP